jgi:hypothetical protein
MGSYIYKYANYGSVLFFILSVNVDHLGIFPLLASCNKLAGMPMEELLGGSIKRAGYRGYM